MKKITLFTKTVFTIRITQNFHQAKAKEAVCRWLSSLCLMVALLFVSGTASGQFTSTWALSTNKTVANTGAAASTAHVAGAGMTGGTFSSNFIVYTKPGGLNWPNTITVANNIYVEFPVTPTAGNDLTITSITLSGYTNTGSGTANPFTLYDGTTASGVAAQSITSNTSSTPTDLSFTGLSISVPNGTTKQIRFYITGNNSRTVNIKNVVISGTSAASAACPTYALTSTATPTPICAGTTATVNLAGSTADLPNGTYDVTYSLSGTNTGTFTATNVTISTSGTGSFTTGVLAAGATTVTITKLKKGSCTTILPVDISKYTANITVNPAPATPGTITASLATTCVGSPQTYNVAAVAGADSYVWTYPSGWTTAGSTTNSIILTPNSATTGTVTVAAKIGTCTGTASSLSVTSTTVLAAPSAIGGTGTATPCVGTGKTYTVTNNTNATSYTWTLPTNWTITSGDNTNTITVTTTADTGTVSVKANNACGSSTASTLVITSPTVPVQPTKTAGQSLTPCVGISQTYSVTSVSGVTYDWIYPSDWTKNGTTPTNTITFTNIPSAGTLTVTPKNSCGVAGPSQTFDVNPTPLPTITGTTPNSRVGTGTVVLGATASAGTIKWYTAATGGTGTTGTSFTTPSISTTTTYYAEAVNVTCISSARTPVIATINNPNLEIWNTNIIADDATTTATTNRTDFGSTDIGTPVTYTYTIKNTGTVDLTLGSITKGGTDATMFSFTNPVLTTVPVGGTTTFTMTFSPTSTGAKNATFSIAVPNASGTKNPYNFAIKGTGTSACPFALSTTAIAPIVCQNSTAIVNVTAPAASLPIGNYSVTYIIVGNSTVYTKTMNVTTAGTGSFTTSPFTSSASSATLSITSLTLAGCTNAITANNNTASFQVTGSGPSTPNDYSGTEIKTACSGTQLTYTIPNVAGLTYNWTFPAGWVQNSGGTTNSITVTTGTGSGKVSVTATNSCGLTSSPRERTVTITPTLTITGTTDGSRFGTGEVILGAATESAGTISWYAAATGGTPLGTGTSFTTPSISSTTTYYAEIANGTCTLPRTAVVATVNSTNGPVINLLGNGENILDGAIGTSLTNDTNFGSTNTGFGITKTYTIQNVGTATLTISAIALGDVTNYNFSSTTLPFTIAPGSTQDFTVTFNPQTTGIKNTTITITNDDSDSTKATYTFAISGSGELPPNINVKVGTTNIVNGSTGYSTTDNTDFETVNTGTPKSLTYTIENTGTGPLVLGAITIGDLVNYGYSNPLSSTIAPGLSTTFTVTFNPTTTGSLPTTLSIASNDSNDNPYIFAIKGTGNAAPEIDVQGNGTTIANGDTTPLITDWTDFGSVDYASGTIVKTFTIKNTGASLLDISSATISTISGDTDFTITTTPSTTVAAGSSTTLVITFDPITGGTKKASITITNTDSNENLYVFTIGGSGNQTYYDSDNDGINDNIDIDDDNDGILDTIEENNCSNAGGTKSSYKFLNETFGAGGRTTINTTYAAETNYCYEDGIVGSNYSGCSMQNKYSLDDGEYTVGPSAQIATWSNGDGVNDIWYTGLDHTPGDGNNGRMAMFNAAATAGIFYTATITGALPGVPITYSFWVLNLDTKAGRLKPNIKVEFRDLNGTVLETITTGDIAPSGVTPSAGDWHQFTAKLNLTVNSFKVVFINAGPGGGGNDLAIDDISIAQTLCDYDNDNVADMFDLDSDNDGIPDVVEVGLGQYSNGKAKMDTGTIGADGLNSNTTTSLSVLDSDGDGIPNYLDLDSDNDSVFDVDEGPKNTSALAITAKFANGDGDINGDGKGDGVDSELFRSKDYDGNGVVEQFGDGILDIYDYGIGGSFANQYGNANQGTATGNTATTYLTDTDNDGIPNYLDITSDGTNQDIAQNKLLYGPSIDPDGDGIVGSGVKTDVDKDGILDAFDTDITAKGSPRNINKSLYLEFDGRNDYAQDANSVLAGSAGSLMAWIDLNSDFSGDGFIVGQDSFHLRITSDKYLEVYCKAETIKSPTPLDPQRWYHVAATYDGTNVNLYLNGSNIGTKTASGSIADATKLTIGRSPETSTNFFKGKIDEVRVFDVAPTDIQVQRMVYQEIDETSSKLQGKIINKEIAQDLVSDPTGTLTYANMLRYYRMDTYIDDIIDNLTTTAIDVTGTKIYNHKYIDIQQAPMPFVTIMDNTNNNLASAVSNSSKDIVGSDINNYYTILNIKHNNTSNTDRTDLGLIVDSGKSLIINGDAGLTNTWWLSLNGKIDLVGKSQLIQNGTSDLDVTSTGSIERDQQGQTNIYNYNYWSSPVSTINNSSNNNGYTVAGVMKDGTSTTPQNIKWIGGYDGSPTTPAISLARYWLYKFENQNGIYANWIQFTENTSIRSGQGYTLKGSGAATATQNYTFVGKPNNGTINDNIVSANNLLLVGNPYPSALDANAFINDNISSIDGATNPSLDGNLYFWEHAPNNYTHILVDYKGGYSVRNLTGGLAPVAPSGINGLGTSSRKPNRYIPVGQGFFVYGRPGTSGPVIFKNTQRAFVKENDATSNTLFKTKGNTKTTLAKNNGTNQEEIDTHKKIRLGYNTNNSYHRQVLLGFMDEKATSGMDYGYDAEIMDDFPNDMYFFNSNKQLVIQGEGYFDVNASYPIGVKADNTGKVSFIIDELENFDSEQPIFIYDNLTDTYHNIRENKLEIDLAVTAASTINNRFSLRFKDKTAELDKTLGINDNKTDTNAITISHIQKGNLLEINNQLVDTTIEKVALFNVLGQSISSWEIENPEEQNIQIPLKNVSSAVYIVKIKTSKGDISKKIIIK